MENTLSPQEEMLKNLTEKSSVKQKTYDATLEVFTQLKTTLQTMSEEVNKALPDGVDSRVRLEYRDRGKFEAEIKVSGDMLIFSMHSNIFQFDRDHLIWKTSYVQQNPSNSYCGIISIYNFLSDSFKYNRLDDLGYLIGRIFMFSA